MTQREKVLGSVVAVTVLAVGTIWLLNRLTSAFDDRYTQLAQIQKEVDEKSSKLRLGREARAQLAGWKSRSLPSDLSRAQTMYRVWLYDLTQKTGLQVDVKPAGERRQGDLYVQHIFQISGRADLPRFVQFMHSFYSVGYLHRISTLSAKPVPDKKEWDVSLSIESLSLNAAPAVSSGVPPASAPLPKSPEAYVAAILRRNFFSAANNPPRISSLGSQTGYPNRSLSITVRGSDADKLDRLTYSLASAVPEGATLDSRSGEFRWTPVKVGQECEVVVRVTDDGSPALSAEERIRITVVEPPVPVVEDPFARDDPARDARVTAMVGQPGQLQVWVTVPRGLGDQPKTLHLNAGDNISVGSFVGVVRQVRDREAEFELKGGRKVIVRLDQALVASKELGGL